MYNIDCIIILGLASVEYQLYDEPVVGDWTIVTVINNRKTSQIFSVKEYGKLV